MMSGNPASPRAQWLGQSVIAAIGELLRIRTREDAAALRESFEDHEHFIDREYPADTIDGNGREARANLARLREKALQSQTRLAAVRGWIGAWGLFVAASATGVSMVAIAVRLAGF
jgi:hypothetical protein